MINAMMIPIGLMVSAVKKLPARSATTARVAPQEGQGIFVTYLNRHTSFDVWSVSVSCMFMNVQIYPVIQAVRSIPYSLFLFLTINTLGVESSACFSLW